MRLNPIVHLVGQLLLLMWVLDAQAESILSRADVNLGDANGTAQAYLVNVTRSGDVVTVDQPVTINPPLPENAEMWGMLSAGDGRYAVYAGFSSSDANFDDLFLVRLNSPGVATQLNPPRDLATQSLYSFGVSTVGTKVVYGMRNESTGTDTLFLSDIRNPGEAVQIAPDFPNGSKFEDYFMSEDESFVVYRVTGSDDVPQLYLTFLQLPANSVQIDPGAIGGTLYDPIEFVITEDNSRFLWRANVTGQGSPEPLNMVSVDAVNRTVGSVVRANANANEIVFEFDVKPGTSDQAVYRSIVAPTSLPGDTFLVDLDNPGVATKLNPTPASGAGFTHASSISMSLLCVLKRSKKN